MREVRVGQVGSLEQLVGSQHAADRFENTGVTVLATPVLCHRFESAAVRAIDSRVVAVEGRRMGEDSHVH